MKDDYKAFSTFWFKQHCKEEYWWLDPLAKLIVEKATGKLYELVEFNSKDNTIIYEYVGNWSDMESEEPC